MALVLSSSELRFRRLIREASEGRQRRRMRRVPRAAIPKGAEIAYRAQLVALAREAAEIIRDILLTELDRIEAEAAITRPDSATLRIDQVDEAIETVIGNVRIRFAERFSDVRVRQAARTTGDTVNAHNLGQNNKQFISTVGIDLVGLEPAIAPHLAADLPRPVQRPPPVPKPIW